MKDSDVQVKTEENSQDPDFPTVYVGAMAENTETVEDTENVPFYENDFEDTKTIDEMVVNTHLANNSKRKGV